MNNQEILNQKLQEAKLGGGQNRIEKQHGKGKLTARERVHFLLDEGSFEEIGALVTHRTTDFDMQKQLFYGDGVVTGSIVADLAVLTDRYLEETGFPISGRRKLRVVYNACRTSARRGGLYSLADIQVVRLHGDDLETFLRTWETTLQGLREPHPENNFQDMLAEQLRRSKRVTLEMQK